MRPLLLAVALFLSALASPAPAQEPAPAGHYLFAWTGDLDKKSNDFLAIIDADRPHPPMGSSSPRSRPTSPLSSFITPNM